MEESPASLTAAIPDGVDAAGPVLQVSGITKSYRRGAWPVRRIHQVLTGADLTLYPGEVVGLSGENGSGKSTLMKIMVGALDADQGTVGPYRPARLLPPATPRLPEADL